MIPQVLVLCAMLLAPSVLAAAELELGAAESDITPPEKFPMAGYYHERLATGTLDPLKAKAIVLRQGEQRAALVVCDLTGIAVDLSREVRRRVAEQTQIPAQNIAVTATHSHTAPDYTRDLYEYLRDLRDLRDVRDRPSTKPDAESRYAAKLVRGAVEAIVQADRNARPVVIEAGSARQDVPVSFNRRFVMRDGSVRTWQSLDNPEVVRAAGPIDPEIGIVVARAADSRSPLAVLTSFALHLDTVGGMLWSGDYPATIERSLRGQLGPDLISVFGTSACGDINHVDPTRKDRNKTNYIGESLATTIQSQLASLPRVDEPHLRVLSEVVPLPLAECSDQQIDRAVELLPQAKQGQQIEFFDLVTAYKSLMLDQLRRTTPRAPTAEHLSWGLSHTWAGVGDKLPVDVQVICVGRELAIVCLPGEVFVDLGLAIKRASPFRTTLVVELANCVETIYIPTRAAYAGGSYEVTNSAVAPGSGEMLVEAALRLLRQAAE